MLPKLILWSQWSVWLLKKLWYRYCVVGRGNPTKGLQFVNIFKLALKFHLINLSYNFCFGHNQLECPRSSSLQNWFNPIQFWFDLFFFRKKIFWKLRVLLQGWNMQTKTVFEQVFSREYRNKMTENWSVKLWKSTHYPFAINAIFLNLMA